MLSLQKKTIKKKLCKKKILTDVDSLIEKLYSEDKINEFMTTDTIYTIVMINLSNKHPVFKRLMNNKYLFDLEFEIVDNKLSTSNNKSSPYEVVDFDEDEYNKHVEEDSKSASFELQLKIGEILNGKCEYVYVCFAAGKFYVGVKYLNTLEDYISVSKILKESLKSCDILSEEYRCVFNEKNIEIKKSNLRIIYEELIAHVKAIKMPLGVVDDECLGIDTIYSDFVDVYIQLEYSDKWPKDSHAVGYAKTAFYCEIYKRSKFRHFVDEDCVVLKYKNVFFKILILEEMKIDFVIKKSLYRSLDSVSRSYPNLKNNIRMVKKYLSSHGYYPFYLNDLFVDVICLCLEKIDCPSRFLREFLEYNFDFKKLNVETLEVQDSSVKRFCLYKKLDNIFLDLPESIVVKRLKMLNRLLLGGPYDLCYPNCYDYDFCLSYFPRENFNIFEKEGLICQFLDYKILEKKEVKKRAYFYYSEAHKMLMVKCRKENDVIPLMYYLLSVTSFKYILTNCEKHRK
ncbi:hypothetical protein NGRA_1442 [Nosema granulosis]|uniref:Nrap protein domain-containing protein n=1 Tax=Nosema granulosis TaxID=83296 RepID=A0A9P6KZ36_9MICR|nr:hypothetical protein NGRA_1442 [Nosema granulosis]